MQELFWLQGPWRGELIVILALLGWAGGMMIAQKAMVKIPPLEGTLVVAFVQAVLFTPFLIKAVGDLMAAGGVAFIAFALSGVAVAIARILTYVSMAWVGSNKTVQLQQSEPAVSIIAATMLLGESMSLGQWIGLMLILAGMLAVILENGSKLGAPAATHVGQHAWLLGLISGGCFSATNFFRKIGMNYYPFVMEGVAVASMVSFIVLLGAALAGGRGRTLVGTLTGNRRELVYFIVAGGMTAFLWVGISIGLLLSGLAVTTSLLSTGPLVMLLFSRLFLRGIEPLSSKIICGAFAVGGGALLISLR